MQWTGRYYLFFRQEMFPLHFFYLKTTTGGDLCGESKMYAISFCQIYSSHSSLGFEKMVFRSCQQSAKELSSLDHFTNDQIQFADRMTYVLSEKNPFLWLNYFQLN